MKGVLMVLIICLGSADVFSQDYRAGIAKKVITPKDPAWLNGYASPQRFSPAQGKDHDLWAKALVLEDTDKNKVIIVTTDLLGLSHEISEMVSKKIIQQYGIKRSQLVFNSSHTHSGPMVWPSAGMFDYDTENMALVAGYYQQLMLDLLELVDAAIADLHPAKVYSGIGTAGFAINRRHPSIQNRPVDHDVPVLTVKDMNGGTEGILFGYACHNTTLGGDHMNINGDYAGYAQIELEKAFPGATALFFQGCGGDINPEPRGKLEYAIQHGQTLSRAVQEVTTKEMESVGGAIRSSFHEVPLSFPPLNIDKYQKELLSTDQYVQRRAKLMLTAYNKGWDVTKYNYPIQAVRFGTDLTILALAGETVVDYALWTKKQYKDERIFVAGYSNEVMCYIPTKRILHEGGYEADDSMIYYVMPGPFEEHVEEKILSVIKQVMLEVGNE